MPLLTEPPSQDWHWQLRNRITTPEQLTPEEKETLQHLPLPLAITPYYAKLLNNPAIRETVIPSPAELLHTPGEALDPLCEDQHSPVPGIVHRYPDRVLFLVTDYCSTNCRYCTRSRVVAQGHGISPKERWETGLTYIQDHPEIRDVLTSGGEWLLQRLRAILHVEIIRIGTKVPAVLPMRITPALCDVLRKYHPIWMSLHFTHPAELTPEAIQACTRLADAGIPLGSQTVLLKGVNDDVLTLKQLFLGLLRARVRPYYLYQCDPILGSAHFRTPIQTGINIIQGLRGHTTGYAIPTYVIDAPGGGGKIPISPDYFQGCDPDGTARLINYEGKSFQYPL
jgi:lysine 2,3-aminomutase